MAVQLYGVTTLGCVHALTGYPGMSDAAISPEPATYVREVIVLPHPVIARSDHVRKCLRQEYLQRSSPCRLCAPGHKRRGNLT